MKTFVKSFLTLLAFATLSFTGINAQDMADDAMMKKDAMMKEAAPTVIQLSQTEGQYETTALNLAPGNYIFEVTNRNVDKDLGFFLQNEDDAQVANSGLSALVGQGETSRTGVVTLTEGSYQYSCPLNPTPHYAINVAAPRVIKLNQIEGVYETTGLNLTAGHYIFEVTNLEVDKKLGFFLQNSDDDQVENSGLKKLVKEGETSRTGVVFLAPGTYQYSCPLNPTPHYTLTVR
ncbi:MAG: hypothetical protein AAF828_05075 [Bacteroidota bacterium]